ncbi:hypothetical protein [Actinoplanes teichomyceticus]|uniref:Uncharacterized protein n=1 Tax=Actinoplanes teichomyceticus TaxID=1867 RepID=A0A561WKB6_ACTTI|nr:hypothetical protein [Actinoplanes teichomyceticus]TWG24314.1 hypothetical protein FHX34_102867 [Actinoplanes teichomyceticus]GIF12836.1 hypothetical protein Ate01nite_28680 [Actinoplanes teichomyceticus]
MPVRRSPLFQVTAAASVAVLSAGAWLGWLGWDDEYQTDPVTGTESGPYQTWQIAGCALTLLILLSAAVLGRVRPLYASAALTLGFTATWTIQAALSDDSGLFAAGALMLLVGLSVACAIVCALLTGLQDRRPRS